jgi:hypothetical protein
MEGGNKYHREQGGGKLKDKLNGKGLFCYCYPWSFASYISPFIFFLLVIHEFSLPYQDDVLFLLLYEECSDHI